MDTRQISCSTKTIINANDMKADLLYAAQCTLGEGPIWHESRQSCFWVDIEQGRLYRYDWLNRKVNFWQFDQKVTMVIESTCDHLILALNTSIAKFSTGSEQLTFVLDAEPGQIQHRFNDGAVDCQGRLWAGTMHLQHHQGEGSLYCMEDLGRIQKKIAHVTISNGIAWSPDNKRMYYIDSPTHQIASYFFDAATGNIVFEKIAVEVPKRMGTPDGMCMDEEGMLWVAHWGGFGVYRWNPSNGKLISKIEVPAPHVTSCAFAGEELEHIIITTARENLEKKDLKKYPQSGDVFVADPKVKGLSVYQCKW